jgi:hypothetical protein
MPQSFPNYYIHTGATDFVINGWEGELSTSAAEYSSSIKYDLNHGKISPQLYFTYVKKKFGFLERRRLENRIKKIEQAFDEVVAGGQMVLAEKILNDLSREIRESVIVAKGITQYIERDDLVKYKNKIKEGHISDTVLKHYTRVIPKHIIDKIKKLKDTFDDFVIWHYYESKIEEKREKKQKMTPDEKSKMRDPILFGIIKETNRLYFIDDWEDEYCDLTFDEIVNVIGSKMIDKNPKIGK